MLCIVSIFLREAVDAVSKNICPSLVKSQCKSKLQSGCISTAHLLAVYLILIFTLDKMDKLSVLLTVLCLPCTLLYDSA